MYKNVYELSTNVIEILSKNINSKEYFKHEINWIENRIESWNLNIIRIGLLGITSSGKSTLVNALIGYNLLPCRVNPTTGIIIDCMKGDKFYVKIIYNTDKIEIIENYIDAKNKLSIMADEVKNPNNIQNISQIEIKSPNFIPNVNDIKILDSPGLNAFNLETHEKITYEVLLGDIDICVFLTSLKPNADKDDKEILIKIDDSNKEYNKQVIIVQNKLDSVLPKPGKRKEIAKSSEQVAQEYGERIKRLCKNLNMKPVFCQISSRLALYGRLLNNNDKLERSQINLFLDILKKSIENEKRHREIKRTKQILKKILEIEKLINEKTNNINNEYSVLNYLQTEYNDLINIYVKTYKDVRDLQSDVKRLYSDWDSEIQKYLKKINSIDPYGIRAAENIINKIKSITKYTRDLVLRKVNKFNRSLNELIEQINLIPEDIMISSKLFKKITLDDINLRVEKERLTERKLVKKVRVKKPGFFNSVLRIIGKGGYETKSIYEFVIKSKNKINIKQTKKIIIYVTDKIKSKDIPSLNYVFKKLKSQMKEIKNELEKMESNIHIKKSVFISPDILKTIQTELYNILNSPDLKILYSAGEQNTVEPDSNNLNTKRKNFISLEIPYYLYSIYRLYELKTLYFFDRIWNAVLTNYTNNDNIILFYGWDYAPILDFINRFIYSNNINEDNFKDTGYQEEIINNKIILYINKNIFTDEEKIKSFLNKFNNKRFDIFTMLNVSNLGHTEKLIADDKLYKSLIKEKIHYSNWIYSDFQSELGNDDIEEDNIAEAMKLFVEFPYKNNITEKSNGCYLINNPNPIYSLMFYEYRKIKNESDSIKIQNDLYKNKNIKPYLSSEAKKLSNIISRTFQELNTKYHGK
jgi:predicted GTPase